MQNLPLSIVNSNVRQCQNCRPLHIILEQIFAESVSPILQSEANEDKSVRGRGHHLLHAAVFVSALGDNQFIAANSVINCAIHCLATNSISSYCCCCCCCCCWRLLLLICWVTPPNWAGCGGAVVVVEAGLGHTGGGRRPYAGHIPAVTGNTDTGDQTCR